MESNALIVHDSGHKAPIFKLPSEILLNLCGFLPMKDHSSLSRTCRRLTFTLQGDLFRRGWQERISDDDGYADDYHEMLYHACATGNLATVQRALDFGFPSHVDDTFLVRLSRREEEDTELEFWYQQMTILSLAAYHGDANLVKYLIHQRGSDSEKHGAEAITPLGFAVTRLAFCWWYPPSDRIKASGINLREYTPDNRYLPWARMDDFLGVIEALLDEGARPNSKFSTRIGPTGVVSYPTDTIVDIIVRVFTPEEWEDVEIAQPRTVGMILEKALLAGAKQDMERHADATYCPSVTYWAFRYFDILGKSLADTVMEKIGDCDLDYRSTRACYYTAMGAAVAHQGADAIDYLIARGASLEAGPSDWVTPLHDAIEHQNPRSVRALLSHGVDANSHLKTIRDPVSAEQGILTPLGMALSRLQYDCSYGSPVYHQLKQILEHLLDFGADPNAIFTDGEWILRKGTPLEMALTWEYDVGQKSQRLLEVVAILLKKGADPNKSSRTDGSTPVIMALKLSLMGEEVPQAAREEVVRMLLEAGADINVSFNGHWSDTTPFVLSFLEYRKRYDCTNDMNTLERLYNARVSQFNAMGISEVIPTDRVGLVDAMDDGHQWDHDMFPLLINAGARASRVDVDRIRNGVTR